MDRCAVFVDAGWFLSEAALVLTGRGARSEVTCRYRDLMPALAGLAAERTGLPLLRIYWYDAAPDGVQGGAHIEIGGLPDVKLRLGRISHHELRGADALLILDLTTLARERAIAGALVVSGDEDVREGIAVAQSLGVRVTLAAVAPPDGRPGLATTLIHEADDQVVLGADFLGRYLQVRVAPEAVGSAWSREAGAGDAATPREFGFRFGAAHADHLGSDDLRALQRDAPMIPSGVAARLFQDAEQVFGPIRGRPEVRRELKAGYWDHVMRRR